MSNPWGEFVPDPLAPGGFRWRRHDEPEPTGLLPIVTPALGAESAAEPEPAALAEPPDHEDLRAVNPDEFPPFDTIDSQMIRSIRGPA